MILFCDTSALVKLYIAEEDSEALRVHAGQARVLAVSRIAWAEMMAALARRAREIPADGAAIGEVRERLRMDWPSYMTVEITQALVEQAGDYADIFALRGYDSVQLASAQLLQGAVGEAVNFGCFDTRLRRAAAALGMHTALS